MAIICNGTTHLLRSASIASSLQTELTIAAWVRPDAVAGASTTATIAASNSSSDNGLLAHLWGHASISHRNKAVVGSAYAFYGTAGSNSAAPWLHLCIVATGGKLRQYENGVLIGTEATAAPVGTVTSLIVGAMCGISAPSRLAGKTCMIGAWLAGLSPEEARALGKGAAPHLVRPQSLRWYVPGLRTANAAIGVTATATDLTFDGDNPRIYL